MLCYNPCCMYLSCFSALCCPIPCEVDGTRPPYPAIPRRLRHLTVIFVGPFAVFPIFHFFYSPPLGPSVSVLFVSVVSSLTHQLDIGLLVPGTIWLQVIRGGTPQLATNSTVSLMDWFDTAVRARTISYLFVSPIEMHFVTACSVTTGRISGRWARGRTSSSSPSVLWTENRNSFFSVSFLSVFRKLYFFSRFFGWKPTRFFSVVFSPVPYPNNAFISVWKPLSRV